MFGSGDAKVSDIGSRWGIKGSHEVAEGLTASYKYEGKINTTNAETFGGASHEHAAVGKRDFINLGDNDSQGQRILHQQMMILTVRSRMNVSVVTPI